MCASPRGAAAAILAVSLPRIDARAHFRGVTCGGFAAAATSYAIVRASLSPIPRFERRRFWRFAREGRFDIRQLAVLRTQSNPAPVPETRESGALELVRYDTTLTSPRACDTLPHGIVVLNASHCVDQTQPKTPGSACLAPPRKKPMGVLHL